MLQFEDLQCPICKRYTDDAFPAIVNEYVRTGRLKIDFRGLAFLGPDSLKALKIALAAGLQNKLWQVVGLFYENQGAENSGWVSDPLIDQILDQVPGLDAAKVKVDAKSAKVANQIAAVQAEATKLQVQGTPWFYLAVGFNPPVNFQPRTLTPRCGTWCTATRTSCRRPLGLADTAPVKPDGVLTFTERTRNQYVLPDTSRTGVS